MDIKINIIVVLSVPLVLFSCLNIYAQQDQPQGLEGITISDSNFKVELVTQGLDFPTTMAFLGPNDFLILEKSGAVKRVTDGVVIEKPLVQLDVSEKDERGLLGIAVSENKNIANSNSTFPKSEILFSQPVFFSVQIT